MLRLMLMRHAESGWGERGLPDQERPLSDRGRAETPVIARTLHGRGWWPEWVCHSSARRTMETWALMAETVTHVPAVRQDARLYHGGVHGLLEVISEIPDTVGTALLLGHNPTWETVASALSDSAVPMTTANVALMTLEDLRWSDVDTSVGLWSLVAHLRPGGFEG